MLLLLACTTPDEITTISGPSAHVTVELLNPTSCSACDPFGVDALDLRVTQNGAVVSSERFTYPTETPTLPALDNFGVVRIELLGMLGGSVVSAGRTAELTLGPDEDLHATMVFLPTNTGLPLTSAMTAPRSDHVAALRRDGTVILVGGRDPAGNRAYDSVEVYDPETGRFTAHDEVLPHATTAPLLMRDAEGGLLLTGGGNPANGQDAMANTATYDDITDELTYAGPMTASRSGHCASRFLDHQGIIFGGTVDEDDADYFKLDGDSGTWTFSGVRMQDFDQDDISGCVTLPDGRTWLQGRSVANSGTWDFTDDTMNTDVAGNSFTKLPGAPGVERGIVRLTDAGRAWIAGGFDDETGKVTAATWLFNPEGDFIQAGPELAAPRYGASAEPWIEEGWVALAGGWGDVYERAPVSSVELLNPETGEASGLVPLDRERPGCVISTLRDGALLVTGGHESADDGVDAAIVIPWVE